jgi:ankyrin repeat protein
MNSIDQELIETARENNVPGVSRLMSVGADIESKDNYGFMPLHKACYWGHVATVNELLSRGANTEAKTNEGYTPLHFASWKDRLPVVKALRAVGANILATNNQGELPIHYAVREGHSAVTKYLLRELYITIRHLPLHDLLEDLTWIGNCYSISAPPLRFALLLNVLGTEDVVEILEFLVRQNSELLSSRDPDGSLPIHVACRGGASFAIIQCLVDLYKASVKSVTSQGDLPLFLACEIPEPSLDTIFLLMKLYPDLICR